MLFKPLKIDYLIGDSRAAVGNASRERITEVNSFSERENN